MPDKEHRHGEGAETCIDCHIIHIMVNACTACHKEVREETDLVTVRESKGDYDGDGDKKEGIASEIKTLHDKLYAALQAYAKEVSKPIAYDSHGYPYFFLDTNDNGKADKKEALYKNKYNVFTPRPLRAVYNYQFAAKDRGAFTQNPTYVIQRLRDSLADLGNVAMDRMARP